MRVRILLWVLLTDVENLPYAENQALQAKIYEMKGMVVLPVNSCTFSSEDRTSGCELEGRWFESSKVYYEGENNA